MELVVGIVSAMDRFDSYCSDNYSSSSVKVQVILLMNKWVLGY